MTMIHLLAAWALVIPRSWSPASGVEPELRAEVLAKPYVLDELGQALERALSRVDPREA